MLPKIKQPGDLAQSGSGIIKEELEDMLTNAHTKRVNENVGKHYSGKTRSYIADTCSPRIAESGC